MMERESVVLESMLYIDRHLAEELTVEEIAGHAGYSVFPECFGRKRECR